ncbi:MAG TPA: cation transporter [Gemmatimonadaceae bacterium]|nr:cation transporter [Gemmatimonadaceae bacterium]
MTKTTLQIRGMSCGHCVKGVTKALAGLDGVQVEQVQIGSATVQYDPAKVTPDAMREAVADEGYEVTAVGTAE